MEGERVRERDGGKGGFRSLSNGRRAQQVFCDWSPEVGGTRVIELALF